MMAFWHMVSNLREYVSQNPPAVTFFVCILTLAISFISLGSYINTHTLSNPDTTAKDWNHLLATLSQFHLCVKANQSSDEPVFLTKEEKDKTTPSLDSTIQTPSVIRLHLKVPVDVTSSHGLPTDVDLYTTMTASQLHLGAISPADDKAVQMHFLVDDKKDDYEDENTYLDGVPDLFPEMYLLSEQQIDVDDDDDDDTDDLAPALPDLFPDSYDSE
ncbi:transmembrane protein 248-like isoform X3 [Nerophis ophidion]|uniref:transmembrane protein 248-like isoform X3 n=1 Tax=Nerophis ophidion TaxID=159077 RepID=UPI002ADFBAFF|nr:transmembrane protein 248-like isoform X3 [Nerophis ophidion]